MTDADVDESPIQVRQILRSKATQQDFRVVHIDPDYWLMPMNLKAGGWPFSVPKREVTDLYESVHITGGATAGSTRADDHAHKVYERFKDALGDVLRLLTPSGRALGYRTLRENDPDLAPKVYYKVIRLWLTGGCIVPALAAAWRCASPKLSVDDVNDMSYAAAVKDAQHRSLRLTEMGYVAPIIKDHTRNGVRRRRSVAERPTRFKVDKATLRIFLRFVGIHRVTKGSTLKARHEQMLDEVFATVDPTGVRRRWPDWAAPSFRQFEHWYYRLTDFHTRAVAKSGEKDWGLNGRSKLGQALSAAYTAGAVGSLDATIWPIELVSDDKDAFLIGPAVVFRIRDKDTGAPLGLGVSLEECSWAGAADAIACCARNKVAICAGLDIQIMPEHWPLRGLPAVIEADGGETHNSKPAAFLWRTKTDLRNLVLGRGDFKPGIEGDWNVLQVRLCGLTPTAVISRYEETTKAKWRVKARLTLRQFMRILVLEELKRMHQIRPEIQLPPDWIAAGANTSSLSMWNYTVSSRGGGLREFDTRDVELSLLDRDKGSITEEGLLFKGLLYIAPALAAAYAYELARASGRRTVDIGYDRRLVDTVYILVGDRDKPREYVECRLNASRPDQVKLLGRSFREVQHIMKTGQRINSVHTRDVQDVISDWTNMQRDTVTEAEARVSEIRKAAPRSTAELLAERGRARAREKAKTSPALALVPSQAAPPASTSHPSALPPQPGRTSDATVPVALVQPRRAGGLAARAQALSAVVSGSSNSDEAQT